MDAILSSQLRDGARRVQKGINESRQMLEVETIDSDVVQAALHLADTIARSDPNVTESWKVDIGPFRDVVMAHRRQWDHRIHGGKRGNIRATVQDAFQYPSRMLFKARNRLYVSMGHKVKSIHADTFKNSSGRPQWLATPGTYPPPPLSSLPVSESTTQAQSKDNAKDQDQAYRLALEKALSNLLLKTNMSLTVVNHYFGLPYAVSVFCASGLVASPGAAEELLNMAWLGILTPLRPFGTMTRNLGAELHFSSGLKGQESLIMAAIACQGSFQGERGWMLWNQTLVQGAWPWLGGYRKAFAKTVYLACVCLFTILRQNGQVNGVGELIIRLVNKVVDGSCWGRGAVNVRITDNLEGEKVLYEPVPKVKASEPPGPVQTQGPAQDPTSATPKWTHSSPPSPPDKVVAVNEPYIIPGTSCNHGPTLHYTGRIKLASSLTSLAAIVQDRKSIAVTTTFGDATAVNEVLAYVQHERMLSVRRTEEQCCACAVNLAHAVGALVVIA